MSYKNTTHEQSHNRRYYESKGRQQETYESSKQADYRSSIKVTNINDQDKQNKSTLNLDIKRRLLSPINKIDPRHNIKKISSNLKTYMPQTQNKPSIIFKPAATTIIVKQQELKVTDSKIPKRPSPIIENERHLEDSYQNLNISIF